MLSSNSRKLFFLSAVAVFLFQACGWQQATPPAPFVAGEVKSEVPFSTREPENFQAETVVISGDKEDKTFTARRGDRRRFDFNFGEKNQLTSLQTAANQSVLILTAKKIYAENTASAVGQTPDNFKDFLTSEWLNARADAKFTKLGAENNLTKFSVKLNDSDAAETIVFVDEKINLPVRQEFYSRRDEQNILTYTVEIRNFKAETEDNLFEIPKDFRKVSTNELLTAMRQIKIDE